MLYTGKDIFQTNPTVMFDVLKTPVDSKELPDKMDVVRWRY
jgi:hypothetical protein